MKICAIVILFMLIVLPVEISGQTANALLPLGGAIEKDSEDSYTSHIDEFLQNLNGRFRPVVCWYTGSKLDSVSSFASGSVKTSSSQWACKARLSDNSLISGKELDLFLDFSCLQGSEKSAGVAVAFDFNEWTINNYILVPSQLYGGNRFRILPIGYPPYIHDEKERPLNMPVTVTNILHLNQDGSYAKVEMNTGNVSTPMLSFFNPVKKQGFILLTDQRTRFGNNGLFVVEDAGPEKEKKVMTFFVSAPGVREQRYVMCGRDSSGDKGAVWKKGDELTLRFKIFNFQANDLTAFYEKVFDVRKAVSGNNSYSNVTPYSASADLILEHHNTHKWFESDTASYYCNRPGDKNPYSHQIGWGGVPIFSFPDLIAETPERIHRVCLSLDYLFFRAQGKTGLFYASCRNGKIFGDPHGKMEERITIAMTRRSMDVLYFGLKSLDLMKQKGHTDLINPGWEKSLRSCADGLVKVWTDYGQFGQFIDVDNGKMDINGSTAGCAAGAGLAIASEYFNEPAYLQIAEASVIMYYERDFLKGYAGGGAAEILQSPDSETAWDMVESCIVLYDVTKKTEWLKRAKFAAHTLATWMVSYDYLFPEGSAMAKAGTHAAGSIFASSQNNHSAPGYYILSGDCMLRLFRATGEMKYAEMYKDQSHNVVQYIGAPFNPLRKESGYVTERVQLSDWEGNNTGSVSYDDSNMAWEILAALTCLENPGIYLHTDDDTFLVMDHIEAQVIKRDNSGVELRIINPTSYDARISILAETSAQARIPLALNAFNKWPKVEVKAGGTRTISISLNGLLKLN